jgi:hypothetical protein
MDFSNYEHAHIQGNLELEIFLIFQRNIMFPKVYRVIELALLLSVAVKKLKGTSRR